MRKLKARWLALPLFLFLYSAEGQPVPPVSDDYIVGPRDKIMIRVWGEELEVTEEVTGEGTVQFFFLGDVKVSGLTVKEIREKITAELISRRYLKNPVVIVQVTEYKSKEVQIYGAVVNPGVYYLETNNISLLKLFSMAGGATENRGNQALIWRQGIHTAKAAAASAQPPAPGPEVSPGSSAEAGGTGKGDGVYPADPVPSVLRETKPIVVNLHKLLDLGDLSEDVIIEPGDYVLIRSIETEKLSANYVWVEGAVVNPQQILYRPGMTVLQAIIQVGGFSELASPNRTYVTRTGPDGNVITFRVRLKDVQRGRIPDVELQPGDHILVRESWW